MSITQDRFLVANLLRIRSVECKCKFGVDVYDIYDSSNLFNAIKLNFAIFLRQQRRLLAMKKLNKKRVKVRNKHTIGSANLRNNS